MTEVSVPEAMTIAVTEDSIIADLSDGRSISVPLAWYPSLTYAMPEERPRWESIGGGQAVHWPDLDEDISIEGLLAGPKSGESQQSLKQWLDARRRDQGQTL